MLTEKQGELLKGISLYCLSGMNIQLESKVGLTGGAGDVRFQCHGVPKTPRWRSGTGFGYPMRLRPAKGIKS
jgi:hypothetical protein